jgi:cell division protein ZipA
MEDNFRNALIIISAIVIAAIFIHGIWTIRKNKNPYKLKTKHTKTEPVYSERGIDSSGFDQDGIGKVKVVTTALTGEIENPPAEDEIPNQPAPAPSFDEEPLPIDIEEVASPIEAIEPVVNDLPNENSSHELELSSEITTVIDEKPEPPKSVYAEPVINAKPKAQVNASKSKARAKKEAVKRNQFELDFEDAHEADNSIESRPKPEPVETEVIVLSVVMNEGHLMSGAALLPSLLTLGMKYGDMNIFHRHEDNAGNGKITFSLANMMKPGTFDLDNMENFASQGISLFMTLPNAGDPFEVFDQMLMSARQLAQEFHGQVLDDKRSVMTKQTEQHYISKIREFERKHRIANA